jgi:hypothetical protein
MLDETFGAGNPVVFNLPARPTVHADDVLFGEFTVFMAGATGPIKEAFARTPDYFVANGPPTDRLTPNGFEVPDAATRATLTVGDSAGNDQWVRFRTATVVPPQDAQPLATDAWPFLYLQRPMIPALSLRGMIIMGIVGLVFVVPFVHSRPAAHAAVAGRVSGFGFLASMFFLGAGFMLIETKAVVHMALLFGSTWLVNSIVFCAVLVMILVGNLFVLAVRPRSMTPFYIGLTLALVANAAIPMDAFLGLSRGLQIAGSCLIAFAPIFFAAVVFAVSFSHAADADRAFGANIAGAMFGGLCENSSMLLGFQYVVLVAAVFYLLSAAGAWTASRAEEPFGLA